MTDQFDSFFDRVNARTYGSLGNDDDLSEGMCHAFFEALKNDSGITVSLHDALVSQTSSDQNSQYCAKAANDLYTGNNCAEDQQTEKMQEEPTVLKPTNGQSQGAHDIIQDENTPQIASVSKTAEELEDLGRLAMFGKQRAVLRRSQIREPPAALAPTSEADNRSTLRSIPRRATTPTPLEHSNPNELQADTAANVRNEKSSRPCPGRITPRLAPRVTPLAQRRTPLEPSARPGTNVPNVANRTPILRAVRVNVAPLSPRGPITRARGKEMGSRITNVNGAQACALARTQRSDTENIESGLRQMNLGGERISRNRAPRTTTSSRSSGLSHLQPVRIQQHRNPDSFLRDEPIPTPREFRQELLHRNASLGSSERSSSTPKDSLKVTAASVEVTATKEPPSSNGRAEEKQVQRPTIRSSSVTRPATVLSRPAPRASSVTRIPTATAPVIRPTVRSSSVTRPAVVRPTSVSRSYNQPASSTTRSQVQPASSAARQERRPPTVNRPYVRPPSVTRPHIPIIPNTGTNRRDNANRTVVAGSDRGPVSRGPVAIQGSARRTTAVKGTPNQQRPTEPRSSVIRNPPSNKGPGDGTPVREFRAELRRYPAPTGLTPIHRPLTTTTSMNFHPIHDHHACTSSHNHANPVTANAPTPTKILSKQEVTAMINRLYMPRKTAVAVTPLKIASEQTHGLSCIKTRSRSTSMARRPLSAQEQMRPSSRALDFAPEDHSRPASADQIEETATMQVLCNESAP